MVRETLSSSETFELGRELGMSAAPGGIYTLVGELGTGKTVFAQGFAEGLGINEPVNSPTFTILQVYEGGRLPMYHFDVYRIEEPEEMEEIGYGDYFYGEGVTLIEWADIISELIPKDACRISITKDLERGTDYRRIEINVG
ncbi:MAG: tRNA (adenosine(37)-N6)-threonylcarbamoyltransferase complex ATPase subunit type 1 TsaE [Lachnospiraceae bacterium]|nr:tRNA (adenosine(37)-N6)-threonylcarbamoyltransferase complex ATPase subunit type 1 TsaE [Lachnospiraceae bacterium]